MANLRKHIKRLNVCMWSNLLAFKLRIYRYNIRFDENEWKKLFVPPWKLTKDNKLIEFQYKILHKVFASQSYVSRFDRNVPELCTKCNVRANTIHMFFKCDEVKRFWNDFAHFFRDFMPSQTIELEHVIFG